MPEALEKRIHELQALQRSSGFLPPQPDTESIHVDLQRLALLIDPATSTKMYKHKKFLGTMLLYFRIALLKFLYLVFRFDFSRVIELHQNVWVMAHQIQELQKTVQELKTELGKKT